MQIESYDEVGFIAAVSQLYDNVTFSQLTLLSDRLNFLCRFFLGRPYCLGSLGEGATGCYDQSPLFRLDCFDCVTFLNSVIALAKGKDVASFQKILVTISYKNANIQYLNRHHFMSIDWNYYNAKCGVVQDITATFVDKNNNVLMEKASALIDRASWLRFKKSRDIKLFESSARIEADLIQQLQSKAEQFSPVSAQISYLPLLAILDVEKKIIKENIMKQFPPVAIIEIVREKWNIKDAIGTELLVSHVGFTLLKQNTLMFTHASVDAGAVVQQKLSDYLVQFIDSQSVVGVNVQGFL